MTVGAQVKQTLSTLKGAKASLSIYQNAEQNQQTSGVLSTAIKNLDDIIVDLEARTKEMEFKEPQYKGN